MLKNEAIHTVSRMTTSRQLWYTECRTFWWWWWWWRRWRWQR